MKRPRIRNYQTCWKTLTAKYGSLCFYCQEEVATTLDHVVPYSHDRDDSLENLVPACALCNCIASDKLFEYVEEKRQYILNKRRNHKLRRAICTSCLLPFAYRTHSPSLFLCAECYDREYGTHYSKGKQWAFWKTELDAAGISIEAHRRAARIFGEHTKKNSIMFRLAIADAYQAIFEDGD
jgi:hypothetical protein